ncbi:MAG: FkbM family methyltransferase [Bdellovibrionota bacterium]
MRNQVLRVLRPARKFANRILDRKGLRAAKTKLRKIAKLKQEIAPELEIRIDGIGRVFIHEPADNLDYYFPLETEEMVKVGNYSAYESRERALVKAALRPGSAMIDIGANVGLFSLSAARARADVSIYAVEPVRDNFRLLEINLERNALQGRISAFQLALGEKNAQVEIPTGVGTWQFISSAANRRHSEGMPVQKVDQVTLDSFVRDRVKMPVSMIKCDVEGYEYFVLQGGMDTVRAHKPALLFEIVEKHCRRFEYKPQEIFSLLEPLGYTYLQLGTEGRMRAGKVSDKDVDFTGGNFFLVPSERAEEFRAFLPG